MASFCKQINEASNQNWVNKDQSGYILSDFVEVILVLARCLSTRNPLGSSICSDKKEETQFWWMSCLTKKTLSQQNKNPRNQSSYKLNLSLFS